MRVLLVDDDEDCRAIFRKVLEISGYEVLETGDGTAAIHLAGQEALDVVLMDMEVPGTNGWETTRTLRQDPRTAHIPVIAVSAHAMTEHVERARAAGCVSYLTKPIEPKQVVEEVERILRSG
jgi:two-component system, cell cycle response regulator DivK